ncbi:RNA polymerase II C-terminal domain phosphatase-like 4 isoform X2 [Dioscorea cayenensis subsp. rotundata]|uniref:RNA polymerase II C-terminal domain phosphatase-like n=1 Tax=Dioscorea cayennensis subsp. rotundata TaxID=55577 RepID=A0AB40AZI3_DIOCR|nr:RNA polymerase II C-terminal domain phosphatase-like 4 isoform X2 [Dioscorea cayenensis subsp. rotundata]
MSLAAESPLQSSSSSDDFAAFLDAELDADSSNSSPNGESNDDEEIDLKEERIKRRKVEMSETIEVIESSKTADVNKEKSVLSSESTKPNLCPHPGFIKGLCLMCGQIEEDDGSGVALSYIHKDLKLGSHEMNRLRGADLRNLLHVTADEDHLLKQADLLQDDPNRSLFKLGSMHMLTKLRPFVRTFLKEASPMFEMYVYTMAERCYALEMARLLDPSNIYFNSKVISQSDCTQRHQKGLDVVLGAESVVVILDDTELVWQKHKDNLIVMERYHYFASSCHQFGFNMKSLSQCKKDESDTEGALANVLNDLKHVHHIFFDPALDTDLSSRDVREMLKKVRQDVLHGCKIAFSRVFPSTVRAADQHIWRIAEQLGALCTTDVDSSVTHVVSTDTGTAKARWAVQNEKFLVNPRWVEAANYFWCRQKEDDYVV